MDCEQTRENQIRLVLVDDQALCRASLSRLLATQPGLKVAGECGVASEALEILNGSTVDIVLMDWHLGAEPAGELISAARRAGYKGRFLIVADAADAKQLASAIKVGASGVFLKSEALDRLTQAIRMVASGAVWVDQKVIQLLANQVVDRPHLGGLRCKSPLTDRQEKVLLGILGGLTNRQIGADIDLSEGSVKSVVQQLFLRAGVRKRSQLVRSVLEGSLGVAREVAKSARDAFEPDFGLMRLK